MAMVPLSNDRFCISKLYNYLFFLIKSQLWSENANILLVILQHYNYDTLLNL